MRIDVNSMITLNNKEKYAVLEKINIENMAFKRLLLTLYTILRSNILAFPFGESVFCSQKTREVYNVKKDK